MKRFSFRPILTFLQEQPPERLTLRLTAVFLILYPIDYPALYLKILAAVMLFYAPALMNRWIWLAAFAECARIVISRWFAVNNHEFLITYWCLVCWLAVQMPAPQAVLSHNARVLLGLSFLFAEIWKFLGGEFTNGAFLYASFLKDPRFAEAATWISSLSAEELFLNRDWINALTIAPARGVGVVLNADTTLKLLALIGSYWTILIEGVIAAVFLIPGRSALFRYRSIPLMVFIATTYFLVPLHRFALILNVMGFAHCPKEMTRIRLAHLILFVIVLLY